LGTQRVEEVLSAEFPGVPIVRMDADTTRGKRGHDLALERFAAADTRVLLGTQMVAKGHDFPEVSLVGVIAADLALHLPDLRAAERTYQLVHQVAGRAGRGDLPGRVVVQTYCPEHYAIAALPSWRLDDFYARELAYRRELGYPPYGALVNLLVSGKDARGVEGAAKALHEHLANGTAAADPPRAAAATARGAGPAGAVELLGPCPAPLSRLAGHHRWHLLVKGPDGETLRAWLGPELRTLRARLPKTVSLAVDVDPLWLM
jgi:primosomal protein N' (replication factor Y)